MKKLALLACAVLTLSTISAYAGDVGVVDMKQIFTESPKAKQIKDSLEKRFTGQKDALEKLKSLLQSDMQDYEKNKTVMSKSDLSTLHSKIEKEDTQYREDQAKFQQAVFAAQNEALTNFMDTVKTSVEKVAQKKGVDVVLPKNTVLYSQPKLDLTQAVLDDMK